MLIPAVHQFDLHRGRQFVGTPLHSTRHFFKYYWWVITKDKAVETPRGPIPLFEDFRRPETALTTFDAMLKARDLDDYFETYFIYNRQVRRLDPQTPWYNTLMLQGGGAPSYDEDDDRPWRGHK